MNEHIEVVKKWLADNDSVSQEQLSSSRDYAFHAFSAATFLSDAAFDAFGVAEAVAEAANLVLYATEAATEGNADAAYWVKKYEELTNE
tara:strand:- start:600 stop:866 length:267 start_codon:yes stop_codon:yes gene_type:complete